MTSSIHLTDAALRAAIDFQKSVPQYQNLHLRLYIEGKGCDGFTYGVTFDASTPDDLSFEYSPITVIVDRNTLQFVDGSTIDFVDGEGGRGFVVENPCSKQFRGKFYKKKEWREKLEASL
jgi:iron-sulfur cluster assembly accessory protein